MVHTLLLIGVIQQTGQLLQITMVMGKQISLSIVHQQENGSSSEAVMGVLTLFSGEIQQILLFKVTMILTIRRISLSIAPVQDNGSYSNQAEEDLLFHGE